MALASPSSPLRIATFESLETVPLSAEDSAAYARVALHEVVIALGIATIAVRFSPASAAAAFAERFGDMLADRTGDIIVYVVALDREAYFWLSPGDARRWSEPASDELLVFFADNVAMYHHFSTSNDLGLHAAVVASASRVIALTGATAKAAVRPCSRRATCCPARSTWNWTTA